MRKALPLLLLLVILLFTGWVRCSNWDRVLHGGGVYFFDGDCYARMTRAKAVMGQPGLVLREHRFENFPVGTAPHTTAPLDYLIVALAVVLKPLTAQALDVAGAFVSPVLGIITALMLFFWARSAGLTPWAMLCFFAVSPILVHGNALGRPDHQGLLMLCAGVALGAEWMVARKPSKVWAFAGGLAWGLGLWVSLFEPLVLLAVAQLLGFLSLGRGYWSRDRLRIWVTLGTVLLAALALEGWRLNLPSGPLFQRWAANIGEMGSSPGLLMRWIGWGILPVPLLLGARRQTRPVLFLLAVLGVLTLQHLRWGYFFALAFAMSLPLVMSFVKRPWVAWSLLVLSLWPVAQEWDDKLSRLSEDLVTVQDEKLREVALQLGQSAGGVLAPWWISPALSYWSGLPAVAGSSHQSLEGIAESARFFITTDPGQARALLRQRKVSWIVAGQADRILENSAAVLGTEAPAHDSMAELLFMRPSAAPRFLRFEYGNEFFKAYRFEDTQ